MTTELAAGAFRAVGPSGAIPNHFVVPYYLDDLNDESPSRA
jgi:hypothetical protein